MIQYGHHAMNGNYFSPFNHIASIGGNNYHSFPTAFGVGYYDPILFANFSFGFGHSQPGLTTRFPTEDPDEDIRKEIDINKPDGKPLYEYAFRIIVPVVDNRFGFHIVINEEYHDSSTVEGGNDIVWFAIGNR